jgi:hypothetical protein
MSYSYHYLFTNCHILNYKAFAYIIRRVSASVYPQNGYGARGSAASRDGQFVVIQMIYLLFLMIVQGATVAQARAALKLNRDVMEAAEQIFEGYFDTLLDDDDDVQMESVTDKVGGTEKPSVRRRS